MLSPPIAFYENVKGATEAPQDGKAPVEAGRVVVVE